MSLFKDASTVSDIPSKVLFYGPPGVGKTHCALTWPEPVVIDGEGGRVLHFRDRFGFSHFAPRNYSELRNALKELQDPQAPGRTTVYDAMSATYEKIALHRTRTIRRQGQEEGEGTVVTDYVAVNKLMAIVHDYAFSVPDRHFIVTAHQTEKYDVKPTQDGGVASMRKAGVNFVGDQRIRHLFDFIFRVDLTNGEPPSEALPTFIVEKTSSVHLTIGQRIQGLDYAKFVELTRGRPKTVNPQPANDGGLIDPTRVDKIHAFIAENNIPAGDVFDAITKATGGVACDIDKLTTKQAKIVWDEFQAWAHDQRVLAR